MRSASAGVKGSGAWGSPAMRVARPSAPRPQRRATVASTSARGVSSPATQALEARQRSDVVDDVADGGAIAGAGEAVRQAPVLQRLGDRTVAPFDIGEDFDRRRETAAEFHRA